jgi:hypothetical protein
MVAMCHIETGGSGDFGQILPLFFSVALSQGSFLCNLLAICSPKTKSLVLTT